jgi:hypothetical protein
VPSEGILFYMKSMVYSWSPMKLHTHLQVHITYTMHTHTHTHKHTRTYTHAHTLSGQVRELLLHLAGQTPHLYLRS